MTLQQGTAHKIPKDLSTALAKASSESAWNALTPLGRNEFICWVEEAKQTKTRERRISRTVQEIKGGRRRPCCWMGCIHRTDKAISPSIKGILEKRTKKA